MRLTQLLFLVVLECQMLIRSLGQPPISDNVNGTWIRSLTVVATNEWATGLASMPGLLHYRTKAAITSPSNQEILWVWLTTSWQKSLLIKCLSHTLPCKSIWTHEREPKSSPKWRCFWANFENFSYREEGETPSPHLTPRAASLPTHPPKAAFGSLF